MPYDYNDFCPSCGKALTPGQTCMDCKLREWSSRDFDYDLKEKTSIIPVLLLLAIIVMIFGSAYYIVFSIWGLQEVFGNFTHCLAIIMGVFFMTLILAVTQ